MSQFHTIKQAATGRIILARARWCASFWCKFRGLQLVRKLADDEGLLFVYHSESRSNTTIHMFFMLFSIGVIWMDAGGKVVDKCLAKPWRPVYAPKQPAQYFIEANPDILEQVEIGDILEFAEVSG